ncbi:MAG: polyribonucleotide nucleotidyltransferase, partial [Carnobacterium sp.]
ENVEDVVKLGDTVKVKIMKIDDKGRVDASMRALVEKPEGYVEPERKPRERRENGDRRKGNGNNRGNGFDRRNNDRNNQGNKVGNHSFERRERKSHIDEEFPELSTKKPE